MRRVYRLAGLMECVLNAPSPGAPNRCATAGLPILPEERETLKVAWRGDVHHFLLPLDLSHYDSRRVHPGIAAAPSLKELYGFLEAESNAQSPRPPLCALRHLSATYSFGTRRTDLHLTTRTGMPSNVEFKVGRNKSVKRVPPLFLKGQNRYKTMKAKWL